MQTIFERVSAWNAARYEQEFNLELAHSLLSEEYGREWLPHYEEAAQRAPSALQDAKLLDDLADICFVAFGIVWKIGGTWQDIAAAQERVLDRQIQALEMWPQIRPGFFIGSLIDSFKYDSELGVIDSMTQIINCCVAEAMYSLCVTPDQFHCALLAVCDSNDSKSIKRVAANVKANAGDKGPFYVPPTAALVQIMMEAKYGQEKSF